MIPAPVELPPLPVRCACGLTLTGIAADVGRCFMCALPACSPWSHDMLITDRTRHEDGTGWHTEVTYRCQRPACTYSYTRSED